MCSPRILLMVVLFASATAISCAQDGTTSVKKNCPYIVSPKHPKDSLGETVYEVQGDDQKDIPAVPAVCGPPKVLKLAQPKFPKSLIKSKFSADVTVTFVGTAQGTVVDAVAEGEANADAAQAAVDALKEFTLQPATLDGKPVAVLMKLKVHFGLRKGLFTKKEYPDATP